MVGRTNGLIPNAQLYACMLGTRNANTVAIPSLHFVTCDTNYFVNDSGKLTCQKAGTYYVRIGVKGCYNSSGSRIDGTAYLYVNNTSKMSIASSATSFAQKNMTITLAKGDVVELRAKNNTNSGNLEPVYMYIRDQ